MHMEAEILREADLALLTPPTAPFSAHSRTAPGRAPRIKGPHT